VAMLGVLLTGSEASAAGRLRVGVAGLTHTHVHALLGRPDRGDIEIVGIVETNRALAERFLAEHQLSTNLLFDSLADLIARAKPGLVAAYGTIREHPGVVETCAPHGVHVMVEKPLALTLADARRMQAVAERHGIRVFTNYETTWYATHHRAWRLVREERAIGELRKVVAHHGHPGPKEIGVNREFLEWLTDPAENGGGAVTDMGCYGANLITWLAGGRRPTSVQAMTWTMKPDVYPRVDDEATIVLRYPDMQGIIQASWNWPFERKDLEIYGVTGYVLCDTRARMRLRLPDGDPERRETFKEREAPLDDPFAYYAAVIAGTVTMPPGDPSSLENNLIVMAILDAARESARTGRAVEPVP
jgi:predicted dehydrogenase